MAPPMPPWPPTPTSPTRPTRSAGSSPRSRTAGTWPSATGAIPTAERWRQRRHCGRSAAGSSTGWGTPCCSAPTATRRAGSRASAPTWPGSCSHARGWTGSPSTSRCCTWSSAIGSRWWRSRSTWPTPAAPPCGRSGTPPACWGTSPGSVAGRPRAPTRPQETSYRRSRSPASGSHPTSLGRLMADLDAIFKAYDVRGVVPDQIDAALCGQIGAAFARFVLDHGDGRLRASRTASPGPERPGAEGAKSGKHGAKPRRVLVGADLGLASTDLMYFAAGSLDAPGAMFTASHNPARYNGIKLCLAGARPIGQDTGLDEIRRLAASGIGPAPTEAGRIEPLDLLADFARHVRSFVDVGALRPLKIVADTANGMGGLVVPKVFEGLPFELDMLYAELDGTFPNHPADPIQLENLRDLRARVRATGADVGLAFDGDADRVFLVDDRGEPLSGSTTTSIVATGILEREPGATILHNLICSKAVPEIVREQGGTPVRTRVGHSFIKEVMAETGAAFGGEHSAHYYFRDNYRADSGSIAALVVLERICKAGVPLSELRKPFDRYAASGEINTTVDDPAAVVDRVAAAYAGASQDRLDGLTVDAGDWWFNLRPSNTEPLLRLNLEAPDRTETDRHVAAVRAIITET